MSGPHKSPVKAVARRVLADLNPNTNLKNSPSRTSLKSSFLNSPDKRAPNQSPILEVQTRPSAQQAEPSIPTSPPHDLTSVAMDLRAKLEEISKRSTLSKAGSTNFNVSASPDTEKEKETHHHHISPNAFAAASELRETIVQHPQPVAASPVLSSQGLGELPKVVQASASNTQRTMREDEFEIHVESSQDQHADTMNVFPNLPAPRLESQDQHVFKGLSQGSMGMSSLIDFDPEDNSESSTGLIHSDATEKALPSTNTTSVEAAVGYVSVSEPQAPRMDHRALVQKMASSIRARLQFATFRATTKQVHVPIHKLGTPKTMEQTASHLRAQARIKEERRRNIRKSKSRIHALKDRLFEEERKIKKEMDMFSEAEQTQIMIEEAKVMHQVGANAQVMAAHQNEILRNMISNHPVMTHGRATALAAYPVLQLLQQQHQRPVLQGGYSGNTMGMDTNLLMTAGVSTPNHRLNMTPTQPRISAFNGAT